MTYKDVEKSFRDESPLGTLSPSIMSTSLSTMTLMTCFRNRRGVLSKPSEVSLDIVRVLPVVDIGFGRPVELEEPVTLITQVHR